MKAIGYRQPGPIEQGDALIDIGLPRRTPTGHDLQEGTALGKLVLAGFA